MREKAYNLLFDLLHDDLLCGEIEINCHTWSNGNRKKYTQKIRSIIYNLKNNKQFYDDVCERKYTFDELMKLSPEDMNEHVWKQVFDNINDKRQRLENSTKKVNSMCGI